MVRVSEIEPPVTRQPCQSPNHHFLSNSSFQVSSFRVLFFTVLSFRVLSFRVLFFRVLSCRVLSFRVSFFWLLSFLVSSLSESDHFSDSAGPGYLLLLSLFAIYLQPYLCHVHCIWSHFWDFSEICACKKVTPWWPWTCFGLAGSLTMHHHCIVTFLLFLTCTNAISDSRRQGKANIFIRSLFQNYGIIWDFFGNLSFTKPPVPSSVCFGGI